jgi:SAM-dependent methyltransferase
MALYVQYGCGMSCPEGWTNYDASPRLWLQRLPLAGAAFRRGAVVFPPNVRYGDIVRGLPHPESSIDGIYASHVLEHLSFEDFRIALRQTLRLLKPGGRFRLVVPDLEALVGFYQRRVVEREPETNNWLMRSTGLGVERRPRGLRALAHGLFGGGAHLWMWDEQGLASELREAGFAEIRRCQFGDSADAAFAQVEEAARFEGCCAMEARQPGGGA